MTEFNYNNLELTINDFQNAYYEIKDNLNIIEEDLNYICEYIEKEELENEKLRNKLEFLLENDRIKEEKINDLKNDIEKLKKLFKCMILLK